MIVMLEKNFKSCYGLPIINKIDTLIFTATYPSTGCNSACRDICCSGGTPMDIHTFEKLLKHKAAPDFKGVTWEGYAFKDDIYSPGGKECYTKFDNNRCMFQNPGCRHFASCSCRPTYPCKILLIP